MIPCPYCGAPQEESSAVCPSCGAEFLPQETLEEQTAEPVMHEPPLSAPKKRLQKKWIILGMLIGFVLLFGVILAVSLHSRTDPNVGTYIAVKAKQNGIEVDMQELFGGELVVELLSRGRCTVTLGEKKGSGEWTLDGNRLTIDDGAATFTGSLKNDRMTLKNLMGYDFYLTRNGVGRTDSDDTNNSPSGFSDDTTQADWWNGDWYGWWMISSCEKGYEALENQWWDCCATIELDKDGKGHILIWDEDLPHDNPLAEFALSLISDDSQTQGTAQSQSGYFMDMELSEGQLVMNPSGSTYENLLAFDGWYRDEKGSFYFEFYLRPWGQIWDDWAKDEGEDILPYYYKDFYLPAIEDGELPPYDIAEEWSSSAQTGEE